MKVEVDAQGRITLPDEVRARYGTEYRLVELRESLKLIPVPEDPVESLREAAEDDLKGKSIEELKEVAVERGRDSSE